MTAKYYSLQESPFAESDINEIAALIANGHLVALPTETVYGIAARWDMPSALEKLREIKKRPAHLHFSIHLPDPEGISTFITNVSPFARRIMQRYWPGPITLVLPTNEGKFLGFRVPAKEVTRSILRKVPHPVVLSSANISGQEPATEISQVKSTFQEGLHAFVDGGACTLAQASTVAKIDSAGIELLRDGIISFENLLHVAGKKILMVCTGNTCRSPMAAALLRQGIAEKYQIAAERLEKFGYFIASAGIFASEGSPASFQAINVLQEIGISLKEHSAKSLSTKMLEQADLVYVMNQNQLALVRSMYPQGADKYQLLNPQGGDIFDPFGRTTRHYRKCRDEIRQYIGALVEQL